MNDNQDHFNVLRKIDSNTKTTQRQLAKKLGFSLGKLNYCLQSLKDKGLVKPDDNVIITAGVPFGNAGSTNLLRLAKIIADKDLI